MQLCPICKPGLHDCVMTEKCYINEQRAMNTSL